MVCTCTLYANGRLTCPGKVSMFIYEHSRHIYTRNTATSVCTVFILICPVFVFIDWGELSLPQHSQLSFNRDMLPSPLPFIEPTVLCAVERAATSFHDNPTVCLCYAGWCWRGNTPGNRSRCVLVFPRTIPLPFSVIYYHIRTYVQFLVTELAVQ